MFDAFDSQILDLRDGIDLNKIVTLDFSKRDQNFEEINANNGPLFNVGISEQHKSK